MTDEKANCSLRIPDPVPSLPRSTPVPEQRAQTRSEAQRPLAPRVNVGKAYQSDSRSLRKGNAKVVQGAMRQEHSTGPRESLNKGHELPGLPIDQCGDLADNGGALYAYSLKAWSRLR
jgi:hypothetical protein